MAVSLSTSVAGKGRGLDVTEEVRVLTVVVLPSSSHAVRPTPLFLRQRFHPNIKSPTAEKQPRVENRLKHVSSFDAYEKALETLRTSSNLTILASV